MEKLTDEKVRAAVNLVEQRIKSIATKGDDEEFVDAMGLVNTIADLVLESKLFPTPPTKLMEHMTEPELGEHLTKQLRYIKASQSADTVGSMLIIFQKDGITQYGATIDPEDAPKALRELADRIERRETVKRYCPRPKKS